jgi:NAD+ synthase (glutamine-hydrolysing)
VGEVSLPRSSTAAATRGATGGAAVVDVGVLVDVVVAAVDDVVDVAVVVDGAAWLPSSPQAGASTRSAVAPTASRRLTRGRVRVVRLLLAAIRCEKGDLDGNLARHLEILDEARGAGCDLAVFPEMSLTGSVDPRTHAGRLIAVDHPVVARERGPHITQLLAVDGRVAGTYRKRHLGEGEEAYRPGDAPAVLAMSGDPLGVAICAEGAVDLPWDEASAAGARLVCFCAAPGLDPPRCTDEAGWRRGFGWWETHALGQAIGHARRLGVWVALTTQAGATVDEDFPGLAALIDPHGDVVTRLPDWREDTLVVDVPGG